MSSWLRRIPLLICFAGLTIHPANTVGQAPVGAVSGRVTDASDAVIGGATLTIRHTQTGATRTAETQPDGGYGFENLQPGDYVIEIRSPGFMMQLHSLTLRVGDHQTLNFHLEVGQVNQVVEVSGEISGIDTTNFDVNGSVGRSEIQALPLNGRNFLELARTEPGISVVSVANPGAFGNNYQRVSVAGAPYGQTRVSVDGAVVNDRINGGTSQNFSQESVQEFQISSFAFDLSTGTTGSGAVNIVTRSGGNDYHGSLFFYYRDNQMAAYPALRRDPTNPNPAFARRQTGFSLSGPFKKNGLFWFANYEHNNQDGVFAIANNHPIFSKFDVVYPSPLNFDLFNLRFDGNLNNRNNGFLRFSVDKNNNMAAPSTGNFMPSNWQLGRTAAGQVETGLTSIMTPRIVNDLRSSYSYLGNHLDPMSADQCKNSAVCIGVGSPQIQVFDAPRFRIGLQSAVPKTMFQHTFQIADNMIWHEGKHRLRFGGQWESLRLSSVQTFYKLPQITLWGPTDLQRSPQTLGLFNALPASLKDPNAPLPTVGEILQLPLRSFIMGIGDPSLPGRYNHNDAAHPNIVRLYIEDGWQLRPNLTLSYGLAYLYRTDIFNADLGWPDYLKPIRDLNIRPVRRGPEHFEPRAGVVWSPTNAANTVLRAGAGLFHDDVNFFYPFLERGPLGPAGNERVIVDGALAGLSFTSTPTEYTGQGLLSMLPALESKLAAKLGDGSNPSIKGVEVLKQGDRLFDPDHKVPYAIHMTAGIQRKLTRDLTISADYVLRRFIHFGGYEGVAQLDRNRFNRPKVTGINPNTGEVSFVRDPVVPLCTAAQTAALDPADQCSSGPINIYGSPAKYRYEGLHVRLEKRLSSKLQFTASYALARNTGFVEFSEYDNLTSALGYMPDDRRHRLTISGTYKLPQYNSGPRLLQKIVNDWTMTLISETDSAPPLDTILDGLDLDGDGISRTLLPGITSHNSFGRNLDEAGLRALVAQYNAGVEALTRRITNPDGTTTVIRPRTPFNQMITPISLPDHISHGDAFITQDLRLSRRINVHESRLLLMGEVFNLFNFSNLSGYSNVLNQMNYGQPIARASQVFGSGGPRAFQIAFRWEF